MPKVESQLDSVIATTLHNEHRSTIKSLFNKPKIPIRLLSDGILNTDRRDPLSHQSTRNISVKGAKIRYYFAEERNKTYYRLVSMFSLISSLIFFGLIIEWTDKMLLGQLGNGEDDFFEHLFYFIPLIMWIVLDLIRDKIGIQERIEITYQKNKKIRLKGNLPLQGEHNFSAVMVFLGITTSAFALSPDGDLFLILLGTLMWAIISWSVIKIIIWFLALNDNGHRPLDLIQFYFALMNIQENELHVDHFDDPEDFDMLQELKEKLRQFDEILEISKASKDIFATKSPSLIVVAIGATTENLMKQACDNLGIVRKKKARPTLQTFIHEYQTKMNLNDKTLTQLNIIREFRNRATHHFNIEWDESIIVLNQFCQFVEWYASNQGATPPLRNI